MDSALNFKQMRRWLGVWSAVFALVVGGCVSPTELDAPRRRWIEPSVPMALELREYDVQIVPAGQHTPQWRVSFLRHPVLDTLSQPPRFSTVLFVERLYDTASPWVGAYRFRRLKLVLDSLEVYPRKVELPTDPAQRHYAQLWFQTASMPHSLVDVPVETITLRIYPTPPKQLGFSLHTVFYLPDSTQFMFNGYFLFGPD